MSCGVYLTFYNLMVKMTRAELPATVMLSGRLITASLKITEIIVVCIRSSASSNSAQSQLQALRDSVARLTSERDTLKKDLETKNNNITQVKKIGRRYKTQYEELKAQHDKVGLWVWS